MIARLRMSPWVALAVLCPVVRAAGSDVAPVGAEFRVDTSTVRAARPAVAAGPDGGFTVVWSQDGDVFGKRYDAAAQPTGAAFVVNAYTTGEQGWPVIDAAADGAFVVIWDRSESTAAAISGQRFLADGTRNGPEFRVDDPSSPWLSYGRLPSVGTAADGAFVVAWQHGDDVVARRYDAAATPLEGHWFYVHQYFTNTQGAPSVAVADDGTFLVAWHDTRSGFSADVFGRRYASDGAPAGPEFTIAPVFAIQRVPSVAAGAAGDFVVAWHGDAFGCDGYEVFSRRFDSAANPLGPVLQANAYTTGIQGWSRVAAGKEGRFVVVWTEKNGLEYDVSARRYDAAGAPVGTELRVNTYTTGIQSAPVAADLGGGRFVVLWTSRDPATGRPDVRGQLFADDLIFADGFQDEVSGTGSLSAWPAVVTDGGDLTTDASSGMAGTPWGLRAVIDDANSVYVQADLPGGERRYRARFYVDPSLFDPGTAVGHFRTRIMLALSGTPQRRLAAVVLKKRDDQYALMGRARLDDGGHADTPFFPVSAGPHAVELELNAATTPDAQDGTFTLWVDGALVGAVTGLDNSLADVGLARMGALSVKPGANGELRFDEFESRRRSYIGPLP